MITQNIKIATGPHDTHKLKHAINGRRVKQPNKSINNKRGRGDGRRIHAVLKDSWVV